MSKSVIIVNGNRIEVDGDTNISVVGDCIRVGSKTIASGLNGIVEVKWEGPLATLTTDGSVSVSGSVEGDVNAGGSVNCGDVGGNVDAGGSINCGKVGGDVEAGGSVSMRK